MMQARNRDPRSGKTRNPYSKRRKIEHDSAWKEGSNEEVLAFEVEELLTQPRPTPTSGGADFINGTHEDAKDDSKGSSGDFHEVELEIEAQSSTGDGLVRSHSGDHVYAIPFCVPGDRILSRVRKHPSLRSSTGDFVKVVRPSPKREGVTPGCKYFSVCGGCQFQMLPYKEQLNHKKTIVEKAFRNFSDLLPAQVPAVEKTGPSPLQYEYRTKLTPHFDGPGRHVKSFSSVPPIGYTKKGTKRVVDIESCPIGTPIVQEGLKLERAKVIDNISKYKNGATLLIREHTERVPREGEDKACTTFTPVPSLRLTDLPIPSSTYNPPPSGPSYTYDYPSLPYHDIKTYQSDHNANTTEYISTSSLQFSTRAGSFFQNNNSILASFLTHLRSVALPAKSSPPLRYLLDAYCGSGLLSLSLAPLFASVLGIEIDGSSIAAATQNAKLNNITNSGFIEADAADLFRDIPYPNNQTVLVIDPPRKGCSVDFLRQMLRWGPKRVVYVSCNVHSQARDVGWMCKGGEGLENLVKGSGEGKREMGWRYEIESLKGWDFFPQTGHVEGLCVLNRVERETEVKATEKEGHGMKMVENVAAEESKSASKAGAVSVKTGDAHEKGCRALQKQIEVSETASGVIFEGGAQHLGKCEGRI